MSVPKVAVAVFVKTPELSPVKTRLAADIGADKALQFYEQSLLLTEKTINEFKGQCEVEVNSFWAVAEADGLKNHRWQNWPQILQKGEGLGARMAHVYGELLGTHDFVCLLGADCPHLPVEYLLKTTVILCRRDCKHVIGPSEDGGFYLFASGQKFPYQSWLKPAYSAETTLKEFAMSLRLGSGDTHTLPPLFDIDTGLDLKRYMETHSLALR